MFEIWTEKRFKNLKIGVAYHKRAYKPFQSSQTAQFADMPMIFIFTFIAKYTHSIDISATSFPGSLVFPRQGG